MPDDGFVHSHEGRRGHVKVEKILDYFTEHNGVRYAGKHLLIDFWGARVLTDADAITQALRSAAEAADATILHSHVHHFGQGSGVSGVLVLAESHISIHTWPEQELAAIDIFMCGACDPRKALERLRQIFAPKTMEVIEHRRGQQS